MLFKVVTSLLAATTSGWGDTSIAESLDVDSQPITKG